MRKTRILVRALVGLSFGIALSLSTPLASAKGKKADSSAKKSGSEKKKVLVGGFDGPKSDQVRKAVIAALKDDDQYDVAESANVKPGGDDKSYAKGSGGAAAVLVGTVKKGGGLVLSVRNGADGSLIQDVEIKGENPAKLSKNIDSTLVVNVADVIAQAKAGSEETTDDKSEKSGDESEDKKDEKGKEEEEEAPSAASAADDSEEGPSPLDITAGLRAVHRSFDYHDTPAQLYPNAGFPSPLTYQLPLGPAVFIDGTVYPLAFGSRGVAANFGITGGYEQNFATKSVFAENTPSQVELTTSANQFFIGLRGRIPLQKHEFGLVAAYGQQTFKLVGDENKQLIPDVGYKFVKLAADAKLRFDDLTIGFHAGTRLVSDTGGLKADWFPNTKAQSVEAGLMLGYGIVPHLDLVGGVDLVRYAFNFNPIPSSANPKTQAIAGGAVDQYVSGWLGVRYRLPNSSHD